MDYEKLYKDALDKAKDIIASYEQRKLDSQLFYAKEDFETIFPELKESENEKIRNALIDLVKCNERSGYMVLNNVSTGSMIAWLEKQGEKKLAWSEEDEMIALSIEQVINCASLLNIVPEKVNKIRTWLKSLKERMKGG